ncbi:MFS transporter [Photobacterium galatheae]|uniref:MFS transporter n=1 Tax=Photobacterium galatheae TaxID=1654360 RepID=UPI00202CAFC1|nr:MFS transporter [Photobacterium galatheae]MCM0148739.1 MFS transporter [Photobacterium galatheae]
MTIQHQTTNNTTHWGPALAYLIHFFMALDLLIIVPFSAYITADSHVPASQAGYLSASYAIAATLTSLFIRGTQHQLREKKRLIVCLSGLAIATFCLPWLQHFQTMLAARAIAGIFGGALAVINLNYLTLITPADSRKRTIAMLMSTFPLALTLGVPGLLWLSGEENWQYSFYLLGGAFCLGAILIHRTNPDRSNPPETTSALSSNFLPRSFADRALLIRLSFIIFLTVFSTFTVSTQFPVMLVINQQLPENLLSLSYFVGGAGSFLMMQWYGRCHARLSDFHLITGLSLLMVVTTLTGFLTHQPILALASFACFMIVSAARTLIVMTSIFTNLAPALRSTMAGLQNAIQHIAVGLGGAISSLLIHPTLSGALDFSHLLPWFAFMACIVPVCWLRNIKSHPMKEDEDEGENKALTK